MEEKDVAVSSVRRYHKIWMDTRKALRRTAKQNKDFADRHRIPAPVYAPGQKLWLSTKYIPLKAKSKKLSPRFICPFVISEVINPVVAKLKLASTLPIHPSFHVSQIKSFPPE